MLKEWKGTGYRLLENYVSDVRNWNRVIRHRYEKRWHQEGSKWRQRVWASYHCECGISANSQEEFIEKHGEQFDGYYLLEEFYLVIVPATEKELNEYFDQQEKEILEARRKREETKRKIIQKLREELEAYKRKEKFYWFTMGGEARHQRKIWVNWRLIDKVLYIDDKDICPTIKMKPFPWKGARLVITEKGTWVIRPDIDYVLVYLRPRIPYRGKGYVKLLEPSNLETYMYEYFKSPRGSLGIGEALFINVPRNIKTLILEINGEHYRYNIDGNKLTEISLEKELLE